MEIPKNKEHLEFDISNQWNRVKELEENSPEFEKKARVLKQCLEILNDAGIRATILSSFFDSENQYNVYMSNEDKYLEFDENEKVTERCLNESKKHLPTMCYLFYEFFMKTIEEDDFQDFVRYYARYLNFHLQQK